MSHGDGHGAPQVEGQRSAGRGAQRAGGPVSLPGHRAGHPPANTGHQLPLFGYTPAPLLEQAGRPLVTSKHFQASSGGVGAEVIKTGRDPAAVALMTGVDLGLLSRLSGEQHGLPARGKHKRAAASGRGGTAACPAG